MDGSRYPAPGAWAHLSVAQKSNMRQRSVATTGAVTDVPGKPTDRVPDPCSDDRHVPTRPRGGSYPLVALVVVLLPLRSDPIRSIPTNSPPPPASKPKANQAINHQSNQSNPARHPRPNRSSPMAMAPSAATAISAVPFPACPALSSARPRAAVICGASARAGATNGGGGNGKWWAPLLGWSGKADYLEAPAPVPAAQDEAARRQFVGVMTEEKARELRARMAQTESFHDAMYHSAIASRLARSA